jgi:Na+/H+-dicarboxylate symporter
MKKWPLHVKILIGMLLGILWGIIAVKMKWSGFTIDYVKPFGIIFMNLLKLIAIPMIITSLIMGVSSLNDVKRLGRIGGRTLGMFLATTVIAVTIGVIMVNLIKPGNALPAETKEMLLRSNNETVQKGFEDAESVTNKGPLQPLVDLFPDNLIDAASKNTNMLQMVIISLVLGIGLMLIDKEKAKPVIAFMDGANDLVMKVVDLIMLIAPIGVFSLLAAMIVDLTKDDLSQTLGLFMALGAYINTLLLALVLHIVLVYLPIVKWVAKLNPIWFLKKMRPVQLLAFSTSSSNATLPVNMENCEKELGVSEEITGFVLPIGATLNMDGTSCYQAVATVFIAQVFQMDLSIMQQLTIILTATLSSIGTAGVPGVGIVMLVIVLNSVGVPIEGIALIMGVDRILDMCRTVVNVTGDTVVCCAIAKLEGKLL